MDQENMVRSCNGTLFTHKMEGSFDAATTWMSLVEWNKLGTKEQVLYGFIARKYLEDANSQRQKEYYRLPGAEKEEIGE